MTEAALTACIRLGRSNGFDEEHSLHDARLALRLFDLLGEVHELPVECRHLLHCAALLHDIGYSEGYARHHKAAYRIIMQSTLPGLTEREKQVVACVARYHRGAVPKPAHPGFDSLDADDREVVSMLGAILRLADGLDRTHSSAVEGLEIRNEEGRIVILVDCPGGCEPEVWAGEKKGRWLGDLLGTEVVVRKRVEPAWGQEAA
jgi:exopolyphosphatase/guanosine-5'-triphosphate,3'-diphosphate pyrophosphatase